MYKLTSIRPEITWFLSPNWTTVLSLFQRFHSRCWAMPCFQDLPVVILKVKNMLNVEDRSETPSTAFVDKSGTVTLLQNVFR